MRAHVRQAGGEAGCPQEKVEMENVNVNNEYTTVNYSTRSTKAASGSGGVACVIGRILHELRVTSRILLARGLHAPHETGQSPRPQISAKPFKVAWFDDKDDVEFFPLHAVYAPKSLGALKGEPQDE